MCRSTVEVPSATQCRADISQVVVDMRKDIVKDLEKVKKVSIAIDAWTSPNKLAFLAIIAYWIDENWNYKYTLIGFEQLFGEHNGENFANKITDIAKEYHIIKKLFAVTTDNASNNGTMAKYIEEGIAHLTNQADYEIFHIPCLAHVIQLSVKAFTDAIKSTATNEMVEKNITDEQIDKVKRTDKGFYRTLSLVRNSLQMLSFEETKRLTIIFYFINLFFILMVFF
jgi:hypothetical protein